MAMVHLAAALALALSASGAPTPELADLSRGALAPAPGKVLLQTRSFGAVTLDHPAHLARKIGCKQCHGPGPVSKPAYTPRTAHETCVGCHRDQDRGPTKCRDCHVVPAKSEAPLQVASAAEGSGSPKVLAAAPSALSATASAGSGAALGPSASPPGAPAATVASAPGSLDAPVSSRGFVRAIGVGYSALHSTGEKVATGVAFVLTAHEDGFLLVQSFERTIGGLGGVGGRTLGLAGAGVTLPLRGRFNVLAAGVAGFDAPEKPNATFLPAAGVRLGVEWMGNQSCVNLWATGVTDLVRGVDSVTHDPIGGTTFSLMLSAGFVLDHP